MVVIETHELMLYFSHGIRYCLHIGKTYLYCGIWRRLL